MSCTGGDLECGFRDPTLYGGKGGWVLHNDTASPVLPLETFPTLAHIEVRCSLPLPAAAAVSVLRSDPKGCSESEVEH